MLYISLQIYIYSGFCLTCGVISTLLMALLLDNIKPRLETKASTKKLLTSIIRQLLHSGYQQLLIPVTIYRGFAGAFIVGDFNAVGTNVLLI